MSPKTTRLILSEYKATHSLYNDFCYVMSNLLDDILKKGKYKYHISYRLKDVASLSEKIERKNNKNLRYKHLGDIEDIAGIRIVFYTEIDRKKFLKRMEKEFSDAMEINKTKGENGYSSIHVISSLGKKRSELSEYKRFKDLKCEIQLTLMLDHAWAEVEHDILYKVHPKVSQIDPNHYEDLKIRMKKIMSEYIKRASMELESIVREVKRIKKS
jgi:ppGpp synthetase/RelA/SpoT-type nucleotidyltranferase